MINFFSNKIKCRNRTNKAFTLVETMVSVSIFTIAILAMLANLSKGISDTQYAKKKTIATYLAQEGIEYVRNIRDTYMLYSGTAQTGWDAFNAKVTAASCTAANGCYFDDQNLNYSNNAMPMTGITMTACGANCPNLLYNSSSGRYNYVSGGTNSNYIRRIKITAVSANETKISSTVFWTQVSGSYSITFTESVYNWIE